MKKQAKEFLYLDQDSYNYNLDQEKKIFDLFNEIKAQVISTLGEYEINYLDSMGCGLLLRPREDALPTRRWSRGPAWRGPPD